MPGRVISLLLVLSLLMALCIAAAQTAHNLSRAPQRSLIAYSRASNGCRFAPCRHQEIAIVHPDHLSEIRSLGIPPQDEIDSISWSPGGDQLVLSSLESIILYDLTHGITWELASASTYFHFKEVQWSRSGRYIAFVGYELLGMELPDNNAYLHIHDMRSQKHSRISIQRVQGAFGVQPSWFESADQLVLTIPNHSQRTPDGIPLVLTEVARLDPEAGVVIPLSPTPIIGSSPRVARDLTRFVYVHYVDWSLPPQVVMTTLDAPEAIAPISTSDRFKFSPRWVLDDQAVVYDDYDGEGIRSHLILYHIEGEESYVMPTLPVVYTYDVSPDSRSLVYVGTDDGMTLALCVIDLLSFEQTCRVDPGLLRDSRVAWAR